MTGLRNLKFAQRLVNITQTCHKGHAPDSSVCLCNVSRVFHCVACQGNRMNRKSFNAHSKQELTPKGRLLCVLCVSFDIFCTIYFTIFQLHCAPVCRFSMVVKLMDCCATFDTAYNCISLQTSLSQRRLRRIDILAAKRLKRA